MSKYTQGVCEDGAAILKDGQPMTIDEIVSELNAQQWIPVSERLPEENSNNILVYFDDGEFTVADFEKWDKGKYKGEWHYFCEFTGEVTHWMPLPPAPGNE